MDKVHNSRQNAKYKDRILLDLGWRPLGSVGTERFTRDGIHTIKESKEEEISYVQSVFTLCPVELLQKPQGIHHAHGVVNEEGIVVLPQVTSTLSQKPVLLPSS